MVDYNGLRRVGFIVVLLLLGGCTKAYTEYSGPPRPETAIAVITPDSGVRIHAVNDKVVDVKPGSAKGLYTTYNRVQVLPGEHTLTLIPQGIHTVKTFTKLTTRVEAGKRYRVRSQFYPGTTDARGYYKFWVDNEKTGAVVSNIAESRNPFQP
jgi:hypothetical protein